MNQREAAIISAYTGVSFGAKSFSSFHKYAEEKFGHPVWTSTMAENGFWLRLKELSKEDFIQLAKDIE